MKETRTYTFHWRDAQSDPPTFGIQPAGWYWFDTDGHGGGPFESVADALLDAAAQEAS